MTEAEALTIAMKAIVSAFVSATPAPTPAAPTPALTPKRKPRRKKKPAAASSPRSIAFEDLPAMPRFDLPLSPEFEEQPDAPPPVTIAELEAMLSGKPPEGQYAREEQEDVGGGWLAP